MLAYHGGHIPAHFMLDGTTRRRTITDFPATGENWANFHVWQKYARRKKFYSDVWRYVTRFGSLLGFALTAIKLWEMFGS